MHQLLVQRKGDNSIFVYIPIPNAGMGLYLQRTLLRLLGDPRRMELIEPERFHVTLLWAEEATDTQVVRMVNSFWQYPAFPLYTSHVGTFPLSEERPIVVFMRLSEELVGLQKMVYDAAVRARIVSSSYSKPTLWQPHMTLAYDREGRNRIPNIPINTQFARVQTNVARDGFKDVFYVDAADGIKAV